MEKKILLTGSGGFIGTNLKEYLKDKYNLLTPRSFELDLCNKDEVENYFSENAIDFIIHCGSIGGERGVSDKENTLERNLKMVDNLLDIRKKDTRIILFGSGAMYDKTRPLCKIGENEIGKVNPKDLYGLSKMEIALKVKDQKEALCLNIFACYGYGEKESRFPSYAINQVLRGEPIEINQNVIFDYLFVEDMQKIVHHFIENSPKDNIINITPTESISLVEIADIINSFGNKKVSIKINKPEMNNEYTGSNALLLENFKELKFITYEDGFKKLYNYIQKNANIV